jgi:hypothetical protein
MKVRARVIGRIPRRLQGGLRIYGDSMTSAHRKLLGPVVLATVPRLHQSGGRRRDGRTRPDVNRFLKWACVEAANASVIHRKKRPHRHVSRPYERVRAGRGQRLRRTLTRFWSVLGPLRGPRRSAGKRTCTELASG